MPTIPSGTKFMGVNPDVDTEEKRSSLSNSYQEYYTIDDIIADAVANDTNIYNTDGTLTGNRIVDCDTNVLLIQGTDGGTVTSAIYQNGTNISLESSTATTSSFITIQDNQISLYSADGGDISQVVISGTDGIVGIPVDMQVACSDETTALTTGTAKVTFRIPRAMTLLEVRASLTTAQASGSIFTVDINMNGTSVLGTKLTIDNTEKTSKSAATPATITTSALTADAEITVDIDQIGNGTATGLKVTLLGLSA
jgi:hypothetical protein